MIKTHRADACTRKNVEKFKLIKYLKFSIKPCNKPSILINSQAVLTNRRYQRENLVLLIMLRQVVSWDKEFGYIGYV